MRPCRTTFRIKPKETISHKAKIPWIRINAPAAISLCQFVIQIHDSKKISRKVVHDSGDLFVDGICIKERMRTKCKYASSFVHKSWNDRTNPTHLQHSKAINFE